MTQTPEIGQGLGRIRSCVERKPEHDISSATISFGANFGNKFRVHIWIIHEISYEIDTHIEYLKLKFQIGTIRKTSVIFVNASKFNVSYF